MAEQHIVTSRYRALLVVYTNALEVLCTFNSADKLFRGRPLATQDATRFACDNHVYVLETVIEGIKEGDYTALFPVDELGGQYEDYRKSTVGEVREQAKTLLDELEQTTEAYPSTHNPTDPKQYWGANSGALALISDPVGHLTPQPDIKSQLIFARLEANNVVHYVNSMSHDVRVQDVNFFTRAIALEFQTEILFRCEASVVCPLPNSMLHVLTALRS
jgi:hypothetical protein